MGDLFGASDAPQRALAANSISLRTLKHSTGHIGFDKARGDGANENPQRCHLLRQ